MATFPVAGFKFCAFATAGDTAVFVVSDTGLGDDSFPFTCGLFPVPCRGLPFDVAVELFCMGK